MSDSEIARKIAGRIFDSFAETPQWTRQGWATKLSPYILEGISEVRKPLVDALEFYANPENYHAIAFLADRPCGAFADDYSDDHGHPDYDRPMMGKTARDALAQIQ